MGEAEGGGAGLAVDGIYVEGYAACGGAHLGTGEGTLVSRMFNAAAPALSLTRTVPAGTVGVTVTLDAHDARLRHGDAVVRSGRIPAGDVNVQRPGQTTRTETRGRWDVLFFYLPLTTIARICEAAGVPAGPEAIAFASPKAGTEPRMLDFARRVRREIGDTDAFARLRVELIAQDLVIHMLRHHPAAAGTPGGSGPDPVRGGLSPRQLRRAFDAMEGLLERDVTLAALAAEVGCSPTHFSRAFKLSTGVAPFAWLLDRRVERAKQMLRAGDSPIAEIALAVGFSAQASFTTAFKRVAGATPAAWRRRLP